MKQASNKSFQFLFWIVVHAFFNIKLFIQTFKIYSFIHLIV